MKAVRIHSSGGASRLRLEEIQPPKVLGDDEVLVRIHDAGVNPADFAFSLAPAAAPRTLGRDFAGQVMETGDAVGELMRGDRVFGFADGSYAEFAAIPVRALARMPKSVDFDEAAALPTPALTAYQVMMHEVQVCEGMTVQIDGAGSIVGSLAAQLADWQGARIVPHSGPRPARKADAAVEFGEAGTFVDGDAFTLRPDGRQLGIVAQLVDAGVLQPRLGRVLPLAEAGLARELLRSHGSRAKIVLSVSHP
jgi:NADPH:quinone reductase-like Zn-dependent oxidoreductase